jgi:hypothetical protein
MKAPLCIYVFLCSFVTCFMPTMFWKLYTHRRLIRRTSMEYLSKQNKSDQGSGEERMSLLNNELWKTAQDSNLSALMANYVCHVYTHIYICSQKTFTWKTRKHYREHMKANLFNIHVMLNANFFFFFFFKNTCIMYRNRVAKFQLRWREKF